MPHGWVLMLTIVVTFDIVCPEEGDVYQTPQVPPPGDDNWIAAELGQVLTSREIRGVRKTQEREQWTHEYPTLAKHGILLEGRMYELDDPSLPWRLIRNYASMQLFAIEISGGNAAMQGAIIHHNVVRFNDLLDQVEKLGSRKRLPGMNVHVLQASGLVSEVNVYVIFSITTVLVVLFAGYFAYIVVVHTGMLNGSIMKTQCKDEEAQCLLSESERREPVSHDRT